MEKASVHAELYGITACILAFSNDRSDVIRTCGKNGGERLFSALLKGRVNSCVNFIGWICVLKISDF